MSFKLVSIAGAAALLAACATVHPVSQSSDPSFGEAVKYDMAVQVIDPDPVYDADGEQPGSHGEKGAEAVKRYRTDKVKQVEQQTTTATATGGGGPQ